MSATDPSARAPADGRASLLWRNDVGGGLAAGAAILLAVTAAVLAAPAFAQTTTPTALNGQLNWGDVVADINVVTRHGAQAIPSTPNELAQHVAAEADKWAKVVRRWELPAC